MRSLVSSVFFIGLIVMSLCAQSPSTQIRQSPPTGAAQNADSSPRDAPPAKPAYPEDSVGPADAVITLVGVCNDSDQADKKTDSCKTTVSRREFELLVNSINLGGKPIAMGTRQNLAKTYAEYLAYEPPAKKAGLDGTERYAEIMRWLRLRMLTDLMKEKIVSEYNTPTDADIARYYQEHISDFDRVDIVRVLVPRNLPQSTDETSAASKEERDKKRLEIANQERERMLKGDDPDQVQKDIYSQLNIGTPPPTNLGKQGRKDFIPEESAELFELKPGEVSKVETEPASYVIYKVTARETLPLSKVRDQVSKDIAQHNIEAANKAITESVHPEYNPKYFGPPVPEMPKPGTSPHP